MAKVVDVSDFLDQYDHPLRREIDEVRGIILSSDPRLIERIKWNAPSYRCQSDLVTFNLRATNLVHLVVHHQAVTRIDSPILQGAGRYRDRRMVYLADATEINRHRRELGRVVHELVELVESELGLP